MLLDLEWLDIRSALCLANLRHAEKSNVYSKDLNTGLVWYKNGQKLYDPVI